MWSTLKNNRVVLIELIPFHSIHQRVLAMQNQENRKTLPATSERSIDSAGKQATLITVEIGSLGNSLPYHATSLLLRPYRTSKVHDLFDSAARIAISASMICCPIGWRDSEFTLAKWQITFTLIIIICISSLLVFLIVFLFLSALIAKLMLVYPCCPRALFNLRFNNHLVYTNTTPNMKKWQY